MHFPPLFLLTPFCLFLRQRSEDGVSALLSQVQSLSIRLLSVGDTGAQSVNYYENSNHWWPGRAMGGIIEPGWTVVTKMSSTGRIFHNTPGGCSSQ